MSCEKFILGTAVKVTCVLDTTPDSVVITIEDPAGTDKVDEAAMTEETDKVFYYIWQTADTSSYEVGTYDAIIKATSGVYTSVARQTFELIDVTE